MKIARPVAATLALALGAAGALTIADAQTQQQPQQQQQTQQQPVAPETRQTPPQNAPTKPGDQAQDRRGGWRGAGRMSPEDRAAFFNARIAAIHAGLTLNPDQEKLWPALESAVRDMARTHMQHREQARAEAPAKDMLERMKQRAEWRIASGEAMKKFADAAQPFYASLTQDQKDRLRVLMRPAFREGRDGWSRHGMGWRDHDAMRHRDMHRGGWMDRGEEGWGGHGWMHDRDMHDRDMRDHNMGDRDMHGMGGYGMNDRGYRDDDMRGRGPGMMYGGGWGPDQRRGDGPGWRGDRED